MVINGQDLFQEGPIVNMLSSKVKHNGLSYGLGEAGYDIRIKQRVLLCSKDRFRLASAIEEFSMPFNLVGVVHDKSTWARRGLSVFNTVIEPGWKGFLTLELVYHGSGELEILPGDPIAQVIFHQTSQDGRYEGKYQDQPDMPQGAKYD
jgi:dCTP deaminase